MWSYSQDYAQATVMSAISVYLSVIIIVYGKKKRCYLFQSV